MNDPFKGIRFYSSEPSFSSFLMSVLITIKYMKTPEITGKSSLKAGKFLSLQQLTLTHPDGKETPYEVVERNADKVF